MLICLLTGTRTKRFNSTSTSCTWPNTRIFAFATKSIPLTLLGFNCTVNYYIPQLQNNKSKAHAQCKKVHFQVTATLQILWMEQEVDFILWLDFISEWGFVVDHCCPIFKGNWIENELKRGYKNSRILKKKVAGNLVAVAVDIMGMHIISFILPLLKCIYPLLKGIQSWSRWSWWYERATQTSRISFFSCRDSALPAHCQGLHYNII